MPLDSGQEKGVYFLANDIVREYAIAFLNSFRRFNPTLPLCWIPYDDTCRDIMKLRQKYRFTVYEDEPYLKYLSGIGSQFCHAPEQFGAFRKLALWNGPLKNFIYFDIDTVVFKNVDFLFEALKKYDYLSASQGDLPKVWNDSIHHSNELTLEQRSYACNSGFILSHKGVLAPDYVHSLVRSALRVKDSMCRTTLEQPLLNYLVVKSNKRYGSIFNVFPHLGNEWAGILSHQRRDGRMIDREGRELLFLHWAGFPANPRRASVWPYKEIWEYYRFPVWWEKVFYGFEKILSLMKSKVRL